MTQIIGVYCSLCRRRYSDFMCRNGMSCGHHVGRAIEPRGNDPGGVTSSAALFECFSWIYGGGHQKFILRKFDFVPDEKDRSKFIRKYSEDRFGGTVPRVFLLGVCANLLEGMRLKW